MRKVNDVELRSLEGGSLFGAMFAMRALAGAAVLGMTMVEIAVARAYSQGQTEEEGEDIEMRFEPIVEEIKDINRPAAFLWNCPLFRFLFG